MTIMSEYNFIEVDISEEKDRSRLLAFAENGRTYISLDGGRTYQDTHVPDFVAIYDTGQRLDKNVRRWNAYRRIGTVIVALIIVICGLWMVMVL